MPVGLPHIRIHGLLPEVPHALQIKRIFLFVIHGILQ